MLPVIPPELNYLYKTVALTIEDVHRLHGMYLQLAKVTAALLVGDTLPSAPIIAMMEGHAAEIAKMDIAKRIARILRWRKTHERNQ